jgi:AcrR family transcriptional regulator
MPAQGPMMKQRRRKLKRTQLERRNETQAAILSASIDLLAENGYAGFSASRVARRAGVSRGAQEHYFPKKNDLIAAATQHAMREAVDHARSLARTATEAADPVAKFLTDSEHFFFRPVFRAMIEIMIAARSDRALARIVNPIVLDARQVLNGIWIETLGGVGYTRDNAQLFIELTHYLFRGVFLVANWLPYQIDRAEIFEVWRRLAPAILKLDQESDAAATLAIAGRRPRLGAKGFVNTRNSAGKNRERSL